MNNNYTEYTTRFNSSGTPYGRRSSEFFREFLLNSYSPQNSIFQVYRETQKSLLVLFNDFYYQDDEGKVVKVACLPGTQEKAIGELIKEQNLILPFMTITQFTTLQNRERQKNESLIIHEKLWSEKKQRAIRTVSFAPTPVDIIFNLNIWSKYKKVLDQLVARTFSEFNPGKVIKTKFNHQTKAYILTEEDATVATVDDGQDRILRKTINIGVETYIYHPRFLVTNTGQIEEFNAEVYFDSTTNV